MTAEQFADGAHGDQKYGKHFRYRYHLQWAVSVLRRFGFKNRDLIDAGWLHDTIEDTKVTYHDIWMRFGKGVADLVEAVTDRPGKNRRERHAATYPGIRQAGAAAVALKLADRIANVEFSIECEDGGKVKMYRKEYPDFVTYLHKAGEHDAMWDHLGGLLGFERPDGPDYGEDEP